MAQRVYLGIDVGAASGRVIAGLWNGSRLRVEEVHRFPNGPVLLADTLRWDVMRLWTEIQNGLVLAGRKYGKNIVSVGADTWGVDYVLLTKNGEMLGQPYHYRDARTNGMMEKTFKKVPRSKIFAVTGLQFMQLNTLYQLLALKAEHPDLLEAADCLLLMPDFIHWALCGSTVSEFTIASTTQCMNPATRNWSFDLLKMFGLPTQIFPKVVMPGTKLGKLRISVADEAGLGKVQVVAPPSHDTASAVAAVPTASSDKSNWACISSGTWSVMGIEVKKPCLSTRALELNLTNEGGVDGTFRLMKNIMGMWLAQQCKRVFDASGGKHTYDELTRLAARARPLRSLVNVDDPHFFNPLDMTRAIQEFCHETRQPIPKTEGELIRCAYESLALKYREVLGCLEELIGNHIEVIHIVGGGSKSRILNQFAANACERPVVAGPVEATGMGNLLVQVRASGELGSLAEMRDVVRKCSKLTCHEPTNSSAWREAALRLASFKDRV